MSGAVRWLYEDHPENRPPEATNYTVVAEHPVFALGVCDCA